MQVPKSPLEERTIIVSKDQRRQCGARLKCRVLDIGSLENLEAVTILLHSGQIVVTKKLPSNSWEGGSLFQIDIEGFATSSQAEIFGMSMAQALLLTSVSLLQRF